MLENNGGTVGFFFIILIYSVIYSHHILTGIYLVHSIMSSPVIKELMVQLREGGADT